MTHREPRRLRLAVIIACALVLVIVPISMATNTIATASASTLHGGIDLGYAAGLGGQLYLQFDHFTRDVPLSGRIGLGYVSRDPGNPYDARHVFINDNNNGTPEKDGSLWQFRFDLIFPVAHVGPQELRAFGGVRHARYSAHFDFVGGNETFDVTSRPWGVGIGLETAFATGSRSDFVLSIGLDQYFDATITGHDTSYAPSGDHVNPRDDYTYDDARDAIDPPGLEPVGFVGWRLGL